ncbi:MAG: alpha/beta hydrolase [Planctomycetes bacterium]|nr:alpha/beta hydrolase [Planctomycetota bacterium]
MKLMIWAVVLVGLGVGGCGSGNALLYWPNGLIYNDPSREGLRHEEVFFPSTDGTKLCGWFIPAQPGPAKGTVFYCHGNAQNLTAHYGFVSWLPRENYNLFLFDYRGFGKSEGKPTREGTVLDTAAALAYLRSRTDVDTNRVLGFGQSLGGACLLAALGEDDPRHVRGIAVESTFYSYQEVAQAKLAENWLLWALQWPLSRWLVTEDHSPSLTLDRIPPVPLLVIHGTEDEIVAFSQGKRLYEKAGEPKQFIEIPGGRHVEAVGGYRFGDKYELELLKFFEECLSDSE